MTDEESRLREILSKKKVIRKQFKRKQSGEMEDGEKNRDAAEKKKDSERKDVDKEKSSGDKSGATDGRNGDDKRNSGDNNDRNNPTKREKRRRRRRRPRPRDDRPYHAPPPRSNRDYYRREPPRWRPPPGGRGDYRDNYRGGDYSRDHYRGRRPMARRSRSFSRSVSYSRSRSGSRGRQYRGRSSSRSSYSSRSRSYSSSRSRSPRSSSPDPRKEEPEPPIDEATKDIRTIFVSSLVMKTTESDLRRYFVKFLKAPKWSVREVILLRDRRTGRHKGGAYVELATSQNVEEALKADGKVPEFQRFPICVKRSEAEKNDFGPLIANVSGGGGNNRYTSDGRRIEAQKVYVGSIDQGVTQAQLYALFAGFGPLEKVLLQTDTTTGISRGFAFLSFRDAKDANLAIQTMSGQVVAGQAL